MEIVYINNPYGDSFQAIMKEEAELNGKEAKSIPFDATEESYNDVAQRLKDSGL